MLLISISNSLATCQKERDGMGVREKNNNNKKAKGKITPRILKFKTTK